MIPLITAQQVAFWVFAPITVAGALGMVLSRKPVHSALSLAGMMVALGALYASLDAPFLFVAQIIVYTGAVMMLFLFTMMIVGVDTVDSLVETIRGQRVAAMVFVAALAGLLIVVVGQGFVTTTAGLDQANQQHGGNVEGLAQILFGPYVFAFEFTAGLLITAALAAIILAHGEKLKKRETQQERSRRKTREFAEHGAHPGPLPSPGVYARNNSIEYPALLPDGSVAENSISPTLAVRGVAIVDNEGLRAAHRAAITKFVSVADQAEGTENARTVAEKLDDSGRRGLASSPASTASEVEATQTPKEHER